MEVFFVPLFLKFFQL